MLIKKIEYARRVGIAPNNIYQACRGQLSNAVDGAYIDDDHPVAVEYAERMGAKVNATEQLKAEAYDLDCYTIAEALALHGTTESAKPWLMAAKIIEQIAEKQRSNASLSGGYASRRVIELAVVAPANVTFERMQTAGAKTLAAKLEDKHNAGATNRECETLASDQMASFIKPLKAKISTNAAKVAGGDIPKKRGRPKKSKKLQKPKETLIEPPSDVMEFSELGTGDIISEFITSTAYIHQLRAVKTMEDINEKRIKAAISDGVLISRHAINAGIIDPLDNTLAKMLKDGAKTIAIRTAAMQDSGATREARQKFIEGQINSYILPFQSKVKRTLKNV